MLRRGILVGLMVLPFVVAGCGDDDEMMMTPTAEASLRVAHLSPDAPNVDVWLDGAMVAALTDVPFGAVSAYLTVPAGDHNVQVFATGTSTGAVIDADVTLTADTAYTVAATGELLQQDLQPLVLVDNDMPTVAGNSLVRFVHLSPDAPAVDVVVTGGATLFPNTSFRGSTSYGSVTAGMYDLEVQLASNQAVALTIPGLVLTGGTNYTVFATGFALGGTPALAALAVVDAQ